MAVAERIRARARLWFSFTALHNYHYFEGNDQRVLLFYFTTITKATVHTHTHTHTHTRFSLSN